MNDQRLLVACVGSSKSNSGGDTGRRRVRAAALQNQPLMWESTASAQIRSLPIFETSTGVGTFPLRKPGILTDSGEVVRRVLDGVLELVRRHVHLRRTRLSPSSST